MTQEGEQPRVEVGKAKMDFIKNVLFKNYNIFYGNRWTNKTRYY